LGVNGGLLPANRAELHIGQMAKDKIAAIRLDVRSRTSSGSSARPVLPIGMSARLVGVTTRGRPISLPER